MASAVPELHDAVYATLEVKAARSHVRAEEHRAAWRRLEFGESALALALRHFAVHPPEGGVRGEES